MDLPLPAERQRRIEDLLRRRRAVRVSALAELLSVSEVTIRRDLEELERQGRLERTHGGAIAAQRLIEEPAFAEAVSRHPEEKRRIGRAAAAIVEPGETVFLNGGTTTLEILRHLATPGVRIVTNHVEAPIAVGDRDTDLLLIGGEFRAPSRSCVGDFATQALRRVFATRAFIGVEGVSMRSGLTTPAAAEAEVARVMIEQTQGPVVVVADSSKLGTVADFRVAPIDVADALVTDDGLDDEIRAELEGVGLRVLVAEERMEVGLAHAEG